MYKNILLKNKCPLHCKKNNFSVFPCYRQSFFSSLVLSVFFSDPIIWRTINLRTKQMRTFQKSTGKVHFYNFLVYEPEWEQRNRSGLNWVTSNYTWVGAEEPFWFELGNFQLHFRKVLEKYIFIIFWFMKHSAFLKKLFTLLTVNSHTFTCKIRNIPYKKTG